MKRIFIAVAALLIASLPSPAQNTGSNQNAGSTLEQNTRARLGLKLDRTVFLYPEGQNVDKGVALGPGESNGCTEDEFIDHNGLLHNVGDNARFDLYIPAKPNGQLVVICPGGGYVYTSALGEGLFMAKMLTDRGIAAAVLHYRMPNGHHIVPLTDAQNTIRYCRAHAEEWGIRQIGIYGASAGGHLAATASTLFTDEITRPDFAILYYPAIVINDIAKGRFTQTLLGDKANDPALCERYSAEKQVTENTPPTFLVMCEDDPCLSIMQSISYYCALSEHKVPAELHLYPHGSHGFGNSTKEFTQSDRDPFEYARPTFEAALFRWLEEIASL